MAKPTAADLTIRTASEDDQAGVLDLFRDTLGWRPGDPNEALFAWKHRDNPFGASPAWVALHDDRVVGYRTFLRWCFLDDEGKTLRAVRAVDTATARDYQGLGIFGRLTIQAVADLTRAGEGFVFNTPNDQSRPGYMKMGWTVARRLPIGVLPANAKALARMARARVPADLWSKATTAGEDAGAVLQDVRVAGRLLHHASQHGCRTDRSPAYLAWRTALRPLHYRILPVSSQDWAEGGLVFRLRRRGEALEAVIIEQLVPDWRTGAGLVARLLRATGADYAIGLRTGPSAGLVPMPVRGLGPLLTTRPLAAAPPALKDWALTLGDVELF